MLLYIYVITFYDFLSLFQSSCVLHSTQSFISSYGLKWHFDPLLSPWWRGIFERMAKSSKISLYKKLLGATTVFEEDSVAWNRINFKQPTVSLYLRNWRRVTITKPFNTWLQKISILETVGIKNTSYNWQKAKMHSIKAILFCVWTKKIADFKTGIIENLKPFKDGKKQIAVIKYIIKGRIPTLTWPVIRSILSRLVQTWWMKMLDQNWNL